MFTKDIFERILATYIQTYLGLLLAGQVFDISIHNLQALAVASLPATLSLIKGLIAKSYKGNNASLSRAVK